MNTTSSNTTCPRMTGSGIDRPAGGNDHSAGSTDRSASGTERCMRGDDRPAPRSHRSHPCYRILRTPRASQRGAGAVAAYVAVAVLVAAGTAAVMYLGQNVMERKAEGKLTSHRLANLSEDTVDPAEWGKDFPRQYDSYRRTVDIERTRHGGSEAFQKLDEDPDWRVLFSGYAFGVDYREERGHAYMLRDQDETERVYIVKQPGSCLHCHASVIPAYREAGKAAGAAQEEGFGWPQVLAGFEKVSSMPWTEARKMVDHPISCGDCHDPSSMGLRVTRPGFYHGIRALAESNEPTPHLPSIERWRAGNRKSPYDPNVDASRQEMRSLVCGQCHVEYYFRPGDKVVTYPWHDGVSMEAIEGYYDRIGFTDWKHKLAGSPMLKAQHPEFEMWSRGIHARSGVACADCHMPYVREGAIKVSDHHVRSPLLNISRACQTCHNYSEAEILHRAETIQDRTRAMMVRAQKATVDLIHAIEAAAAGNASDEELQEARLLHRKAEWRLDFVAAENSMGFHAPQEATRILGEAVDYARQGQVAVLRAHPEVE
jgi:nitrite reductase (cytochrome c-552)